MSATVAPPSVSNRRGRPSRICVCTAQVPFAKGGAEALAASLVAELRRRGYEAEVVSVPTGWRDRTELIRDAMAWRMLELRDEAGNSPDLVIATRFPSYLIRHPNKVVWLVHQLRQIYDLKGTPYSDFRDTPEDVATAGMVQAMDRRTLGEARALYAISNNTAARLAQHSGLSAEVLYPPPALGESLSFGKIGDFILGVGRLDRLKRFDLLIEALSRCTQPVSAVIAGEGPERPRLEAAIAAAGLEDRVRLAGRVSDEELLRLYGDCLGVYFSPFDEDYGYVTVEAALASKPVITAADSGGVLELVDDENSGLICPNPSPRAFARRFERLYEDRELARRLGQQARKKVAGIGWDSVIGALTASLPP